MKIQYTLAKAAIVTLSIVIAFILQTAVLSHFPLAGVLPNIMLILTSSLGFMRGRKTGAAAGLVCGLFLDLFSSQLFGTNALIFMLLGYLNGFFRRQFFGDSIRLPVILVGSTDLIYGGMVYGSLFLVRQKYDFPYYFMNVCVPEMVYTVILSLLLYFPIYRINQWLDIIDKRSTKHSARLDFKDIG